MQNLINISFISACMLQAICSLRMVFSGYILEQTPHAPAGMVSHVLSAAASYPPKTAREWGGGSQNYDEW